LLKKKFGIVGSYPLLSRNHFFNVFSAKCYGLEDRRIIFSRCHGLVTKPKILLTPPCMFFPHCFFGFSIISLLHSPIPLAKSPTPSLPGCVRPQTHSFRRLLISFATFLLPSVWQLDENFFFTSFSHYKEMLAPAFSTQTLPV